MLRLFLILNVIETIFNNQPPYILTSCIVKKKVQSEAVLNSVVNQFRSLCGWSLKGTSVFLARKDQLRSLVPGSQLACVATVLSVTQKRKQRVIPSAHCAFTELPLPRLPEFQ